MQTIRLCNGVEMPLLGFGTFKIKELEQCQYAVEQALKIGYRLIDTAASYGNESAVGKAIRNCGIPRQDITVVSKVWIQDMGYEKTLTSFYKTLQNLQLNYLDIFLVHMPYGDYYGSWRALEELYRQQKIRVIGVSNFSVERLLDLILHSEISPMINQIEIHPFYQQKDAIQMMRSYNVQPMAWGPFAEGKNNIFTHPVIQQIGQKYHKSVPQIILRWLMQQQIIAIPKSIHLERIQENYDVQDFTLNDSEKEMLANIDMHKPAIIDFSDIREILRLNQINFEH